MKKSWTYSFSAAMLDSEVGGLTPVTLASGIRIVTDKHLTKEHMTFAFVKFWNLKRARLAELEINGLVGPQGVLSPVLELLAVVT